MSVEYDNFLKCKTNYEFFKTIEQDLFKRSTFISCHNGEYYYQSRNYALSNEIHQLAKKYPNEEFELIFWDDDPYESKKNTLNFKGEKWETIKIEPNFFYDYNTELKRVLGEDRFKVVIKKIKYFFEKFHEVFDGQWLEDGDSEISEASIEFKDEELKIIATRKSFSYIKIEGFYITSKTSWGKIDIFYPG
jgi:hypothetical protein